MHRVRVSLPYYRLVGWDPAVVCFDPGSTEHPIDEALCQSVPDDIPVHRVRCLSSTSTRAFGLGAVGFRGWFAMRRAGLQLIKKQRPDLILFSTTSFPLMALGPSFRAASNVPYVLDYQDPWVSPAGSIHRPTLKNKFVRRLHEIAEPRAVRGASGLMAVSADYLSILRRRYTLPTQLPSAVIPFGAAKQDLEIARQVSSIAARWPDELRQDLATKTVGLYAGAYVKTMEPMVATLFLGLKQAITQWPCLADQLRCWFIGSNYAQDDQTTPVLDLASRYGVEAVVREWPARVSYYNALGMLYQASFNMLLGSTSPGYNPSKLFTCLLTRRPLLALVQPNTLVAELIQAAGGAQIVFIKPDQPIADSPASLMEFLKSSLEGEVAASQTQKEQFLSQYSAETTTNMQADLFGQVVAYARQDTDAEHTQVDKVAEAAVS